FLDSGCRGRPRGVDRALGVVTVACEGDASGDQQQREGSGAEGTNAASVVDGRGLAADEGQELVFGAVRRGLSRQRIPPPATLPRAAHAGWRFLAACASSRS